MSAETVISPLSQLDPQPEAQVRLGAQPDLAMDPIMRSVQSWKNRIGCAAHAMADLVRIPFQLELRHEYVPIAGSPHGRDEARSRLGLHRKQDRAWEKKWQTY